MTEHIFTFTSPLTKKSKKKAIPIHIFEQGDFPAWIKKQESLLINQAKQAGFIAEPKQALSVFDEQGDLNTILFGVSSPVYYLDTASLFQYIQKNFSKDFISQNVFEIADDHEEDVANRISLGWALGSYKFDLYKKRDDAIPTLIVPEACILDLVEATFESTCILRNLINTPANDLGTEELAEAAKDLAKHHKAKVKILHDDELLKKNFPMIYNVGKASTRPPQLVDIKWGESRHPKVTLVGKGIIYDTGGLNLKPGQYMRDMKKDMGGAAHALGVANMIMELNLPVQLRVLLPLAENSVSGNSFRPGDILPTRKGISVEICDTDAEGRLVLADALTYACEDEPDLVIDFATLTGAARVAVGYDMPAYFTNKDDYIDDLRHASVEVDDPCWPFPLFEGYDANLNGDVSDIRNEGTGRAGHIEAALFLQRFITPETDWIHLDCFAWEQNGKAGRPKGGAETGLRAILHLIRTTYV